MEFEELCARFLKAKAAEEKAKRERVALEETVAACFDLPADHEGSKTIREGGYKITGTWRINRTLDAKVWEALKDDIPPALRPVTYKPAIEIKGLRYLRNNEPEIYAKVAKAITERIGKPSVKIEKEDEE